MTTLHLRPKQDGTAVNNCPSPSQGDSGKSQQVRQAPTRGVNRRHDDTVVGDSTGWSHDGNAGDKRGTVARTRVDAALAGNGHGPGHATAHTSNGRARDLVMVQTNVAVRGAVVKPKLETSARQRVTIGGTALKNAQRDPEPPPPPQASVSTNVRVRDCADRTERRTAKVCASDDGN